PVILTNKICQALDVSGLKMWSVCTPNTDKKHAPFPSPTSICGPFARSRIEMNAQRRRALARAPGPPKKPPCPHKRERGEQAKARLALQEFTCGLRSLLQRPHACRTYEKARESILEEQWPSTSRKSTRPLL